MTTQEISNFISAHDVAIFALLRVKNPHFKIECEKLAIRLERDKKKLIIRWEKENKNEPTNSIKEPTTLPTLNSPSINED